MSPGARSAPSSRGDRWRDNAPEPSLPQQGRSEMPSPSMAASHQSQEPEKPAPLRHDQEPRERDEPARGDAVTVWQSMMDYYLQRTLGAARVRIGRPGEDY
jgi:hypothetical protein